VRRAAEILVGDQEHRPATAGEIGQRLQDDVGGLVVDVVISAQVSRLGDSLVESDHPVGRTDQRVGIAVLCTEA
jgi:hypothetical protein